MEIKYFNLKLSNEDHATLFAKSKAAGITATEFLRRCIREQAINVFPVDKNVVESFKTYLKSVDDSENEIQWEELF